MLNKLLLAMILSASLLAKPAFACSSSDDYVAPSNFELVEMADAIGIYVAEGVPAGAPEPALAEGEVPLRLATTFRLERALAGSPPTQLSPLAFLYEPRPREPEGDDDTPFRYHDYGGGCSSFNFERGSRYLLILSRGADSGWDTVPRGGGRAKMRYQEGSSWARTVDRYIGVRALEPRARHAALVAILDSGRDAGGAPVSPLELTDIDNHLRTPSQWKPTAWLVERYERVVRGDPVDILLSGPIHWRLGDDARAILLISLAEGHHPGALPLFDQLLSRSELPVFERGLVLLALARHGQYGRAFRWMEERLLDTLAALSDQDARLLLHHVAFIQRGDWYDDSAPRWRTDARVAAAWPGLAARLEAYQRTRMGDGDIVLFDVDDAAPVND